MSSGPVVGERSGAQVRNPSRIEADLQSQMAQIRQQIHEATDSMVAAMTAPPASPSIVEPAVEQGGSAKIFIEAPALDPSDIRPTGSRSMPTATGTPLSAALAHLQALMISSRQRKAS